MMIVAGLFDQEDIYGGPALYKALAPKDPSGEFVHLVLGPWNHGQGRREGRALGAIQFEGDTAGWFRRKVMQPFLDHYLKDAPKPATPRVLVYETGADEWHQYDRWPRVVRRGVRGEVAIAVSAVRRAARASTRRRPTQSATTNTSPIRRSRCRIDSGRTCRLGAPDSGWGEWLVDDQRHAARAPTCSCMRPSR